MRLQRPLALLLSLLIAGQPVLVQAAGVKNSAPRDQHRKGPAQGGREKSPNLRPVFAQLAAGGYRDKATEREMEELMGSIVRSLPPEAIEKLASMAALVTASPGDPAVLEEAKQMFVQTIDALPEETREEIQRFVAAGTSLTGLGFALSAILKFKAHKDNPKQTPIGTPIALVFIAAALLFLPSIIGEGGGWTNSCDTCSDTCTATP
jgi:hypothetical protein